MQMSIRSFAVAAVLATGAASASALTIPTEGIAANSVQAFSEDALYQFSLFDIVVTPLGNASATTTAGAFNLPVTSISINSKLKISAGAAKGSALEISRVYGGAKVGVTLANFTINFETGQVLADVTPIGGVTQPQAAVYTFDVLSALKLAFKLIPLSVTGHEELGNLYLTSDAITTIATALKLPKFAPVLMKDTNFGQINIDVALKLRKPVSTKAYVPAQ